MVEYLRSSVRILGILLFALSFTSILVLMTPYSRTWEKVYSAFFRAVSWWCGIQVNVSGAIPDSSEGKRVLLISNHVSYLDVIVIGSIFPCIFLAKSEVKCWPVFGWLARALGCVFVKRDSLMGRANALRACLNEFRFANIAIFPEGTTTSLKVPTANKWSHGHAWLAKRSDIDAVLCLGLAFEDQSEVAWTDDQSFLPHLFSLLRKKSISVTVHTAWNHIKQNKMPAEIATETWQKTCLLVNHACSE